MSSLAQIQTFKIAILVPRFFRFDELTLPTSE